MFQTYPVCPTDNTRIKIIWRELYFHDLNNPSPELFTSLEVDDSTEDVETLTFEKVSRAIRRLKNNKAPGTDDLPSELWKYSGQVVTKAL